MPEPSKHVRWAKTAVTDVGTDLLTEFAAGRLLTITSAYGSVSRPGEELAEMTELPDGRTHPLNIESVTKTDKDVTVCVQVSSLGNPEAYKLEQIGIFAKASSGAEPGPGEDKLLMVVEDEEDETGGKGVLVPAGSEQLYVFKLYVVLTVTNKERLEVSVSSAGIATIGAVTDAISEHDKDPSAHAAAIQKAIEDHEKSPDAHKEIGTRLKAIETEMNGAATIYKSGPPETTTEGVVGQRYIDSTNGDVYECKEIQDGSGVGDVYIWEKVKDNEPGKNLRAVAEEAKKLATAATAAANAATEAISQFANTISVVPSQSGSLTYSGEAQKPDWLNYSEDMMEIKYGEDRKSKDEYDGETDAGTYKAYVTPKEEFTWADKTQTEKELQWTIDRATIAAVPTVNGSLTYNGSPQHPDWNGYDSSAMEKSEDDKTDAGQYSTTFTPDKNHRWPGGGTDGKEVKWTIDKAANDLTITSPSGQQSITVDDTFDITVTTSSNATITAESTSDSVASVSVTAQDKKVTVTGKTAGNATITIKSEGAQNYEDAQVTLGVVVSRKTPSLELSPPETTRTVNVGSSIEITVTTDSDGTVSATSSESSKATAITSEKKVTIAGASDGQSTVTISVSQTDKFAAASKQITVTVQTPSVETSSWDDIGKIASEGKAASFFDIGDTKEITINGKVGVANFDSLNVDVFIIGIDHNSDKEGKNLIHWQIGKIDDVLIALCDDDYGSYFTDGTLHFNMSHWGDYNYGGWKGSDMRYDILGSTNVAPSGYGVKPVVGRTGYDPSSYDIVSAPKENTLMAALPQELRKVMKQVTKYTDNTGNANQNDASAVTASKDYIFLLSEFEVYGTRTYANDHEREHQLQYEYYKSANDKQLHKHTDHSTVVWGRLRSAYYTNYYYFSAVGTGAGGSVNYYTAHYSGGLVAGFAT